MIKRTALLNAIQTALKRSRAVALIGPRQSGKTTLARQFVPPDSLNYFDLEDLTSLARLQEPKTALQDLHGLIVIDEIQRRPDLFPILRVLCDRDPLPARFLILGSASPDLIRASSESLAGRVETIPINGFSLKEVGAQAQSQHWLRGGFPLSFLSTSEADSFAWRKNFVQMLLERDLPQLGYRIPASALLRFWTMLASVQAQTWNSADLARSMGVKEDTARRYLDILTGSFMIRQLQPWFENIGKRIVKAPKAYFRDTGLLHALLGLKTERQLLGYPRLGVSWEGFAIEQIIRHFDADRDAYFYKTHGGAELDLMILRGGKRYGFEIKYADAPSITRSMHVAIEDLGLERLWVIHPGSRRYRLSDAIEALPLIDVASLALR